MQIEHVTMSGFQYFQQEATFCFEDGVNLVRGRNATGKTSLLYSIWVGFHVNRYEHKLFRGQSPRIQIRFRDGDAVYEIDKHFIENAQSSYELRLIDKDGSSSVISNGREAIASVRRSREKVVRVSCNDDFVVHADVAAVQNKMNELLLRYTPSYYIDRLVPIALDSRGRCAQVGKTPDRSYGFLAGGSKRFLSIVKLVAVILVSDDSPVYLLDDLLMMVDEQTSEALCNLLCSELGEKGQVIFTSSDIDYHYLRDPTPFDLHQIELPSQYDT